MFDQLQNIEELFSSTKTSPFLPQQQKQEEKCNDLIKVIVQDAEVMLQLCSFVLDNGFGEKGWHCAYNLPQ